MKRIFSLPLLSLIAGALLVLTCGTNRGSPGTSNSLIDDKQSQQREYPGTAWRKARTPEERGWSSEKLKRAQDFSATIDTAAVLIVDDGVIVSEWGETARKFNVHSMRKSLLSALYGIAVAEGKIKLDSTLAELGIDDNAPSLTKEEKQARVSDLLKARSGVYHEALYETESMRANRPVRGSHAPGTFWYYNNWDFNALCTIYERALRSSIFKEFKRRISEPLQMEDFTLDDTEYVRGPDSIHPAYLFRLTARDLARIGLLYLRHGEWSGKQIISKDWVAESTRSYSAANNWGGYGYMWVVALNGKIWPNVQLPEGTFCASGRGGQSLLVMPEEKLVIVHRVNTDIPGKEVPGDKWGQLLALILEAKKG